MAETKEDIAAQRDQLLAENERLRAQLAAAGRADPSGRVAMPRHTFQLSEGARQELERNGWANIDGRVMTIEDVRAELGEGQQNVEIGEPDAVQVPIPPERNAVRGVDYVYPSVAPGLIDPKVAGTPGINGPAADAESGPQPKTRHGE